MFVVESEEARTGEVVVNSAKTEREKVDCGYMQYVHVEMTSRTEH